MLIDIQEIQATEKDTDQYFTPAWIFEALNTTFDLDVASPEGGSMVPCRRYYTAKDNGLAQPWEGLVWMNPPFSHTTEWADKFIQHNNGISLLPFSKSKWLNRLWESQVKIVILPPTLKFEHNGKPGAIAYPCMLAALGEGMPILEAAGLGKAR